MILAAVDFSIITPQISASPKRVSVSTAPVKLDPGNERVAQVCAGQIVAIQILQRQIGRRSALPVEQPLAVPFQCLDEIGWRHKEILSRFQAAILAEER